MDTNNCLVNSPCKGQYLFPWLVATTVPMKVTERTLATGQAGRGRIDSLGNKDSLPEWTFYDTHKTVVEGKDCSRCLWSLLTLGHLWKTIWFILTASHIKHISWHPSAFSVAREGHSVMQVVEPVLSIQGDLGYSIPSTTNPCPPKTNKTQNNDNKKPW